MRFEGEVRGPDGRHVPYMDTAGNETIGYGHNLSEGFPPGAVLALVREGISDGVAGLVLDIDMRRAVAECDAHIPEWREFPEPVQEVVFDLMFNMGWGGGRRGLSSLTSFLNALSDRDFKKAADLLWAKGLPRGVQRYKYARDVGHRAEENSDILRDA